MKNTFFTALFLILTMVLGAQTPVADKGAAMLRSFYSAYIPLFSAENGDLDVNEKKLDALRRKYCTPACLKQFRKLVEETDGDPILKAQDSYKELVKTLVITKDSKKHNRYTVSYTDVQGTKEKITIDVTLTEQNGAVKIAHLD